MSNAGNATAGTLFLRINGETYRPQGDFTYGVGGVSREAIVGTDQKVHGAKETTLVPFIEGMLTDTSDLSLQQLQAITNTTLQLELINGKVITLTGAWAGKCDEGKTDGTVAIRFEGLKADERTTA